MSLNINQNNFLQLNNPSVIMNPTPQFIYNQKNIQNIYMNVPKEKDTEKFSLEKINKEKQKQKINNIPKLPIKNINSFNLPTTMPKINIEPDDQDISPHQKNNNNNINYGIQISQDEDDEENKNKEEMNQKISKNQNEAYLNTKFLLPKRQSSFCSNKSKDNMENSPNGSGRKLNFMMKSFFNNSKNSSPNMNNSNNEHVRNKVSISPIQRYYLDSNKNNNLVLGNDELFDNKNHNNSFSSKGAKIGKGENQCLREDYFEDSFLGDDDNSSVNNENNVQNIQGIFVENEDDVQKNNNNSFNGNKNDKNNFVSHNLNHSSASFNYKNGDNGNLNISNNKINNNNKRKKLKDSSFKIFLVLSIGLEKDVSLKHFFKLFKKE